MKPRKTNDKTTRSPFALSLVLAGLCCLFPSIKAQAQSIRPVGWLLSADVPHLPHTSDSLCIIENHSPELSSFIHALRLLDAGKDTVLTIIHLGDSHIAAGYYSGQTMRLLQQRYGNAGRGFVAPLRLARTSQPEDYYLRSATREWISGRINQPSKKTPIGPGGVGIRSNAASIKFDLIMAPVNGEGYSFNQAVLYRGNKAMPMQPTGAGKAAIKVSHGRIEVGPRMVADTFFLPTLRDTLLLQSSLRKPGAKANSPASEFTNYYYGFNLTNGQPGILYHSIGVNGAMFVHYSDPDFLPRLAALKPSLLIVSLGTNESIGIRFNADVFARQVRKFLGMVKEYMPQTAILLTTPADAYKRTRVNRKYNCFPNENMDEVAATLTAIAREEGLASWDLFSATGGKHSGEQWFNTGLLSGDRVHFSREGYIEHGRLLYLAFMRLTEPKPAIEAIPNTSLRNPLLDSLQEDRPKISPIKHDRRN